MLHDLSHTIHPGMTVFSAAVPQPKLDIFWSHQDSQQSGKYKNTTCELHSVSFVTSIGTYMDAPFHFHPNKATIDQIPLEKCILPGIVIDCTSAKGAISVDLLQPCKSLLQGKAVLLYTGFDKYWNTETYQQNYPYVGKELAQFLIESQAHLVGIDTLTIDTMQDAERPAHTLLLGNDILIVENLCNLASLLQHACFTFHAVPIKYQGAAAFPVRAYACS